MLGDTIFAVASPPGPAARGIVRVSGPEALEKVNDLLDRSVPGVRGARERELEILGFPVACLVLVMPGPGSYTGEDVVELHLPGGDLLLEHVQVRLRGAGLRDATPGEFTRRAFEHGRLDLAEAEAVAALIEAAGEEERTHALFVLEGGLATAVERVRRLVEDGRALLEAGLDFAAGETGQVEMHGEPWRAPLEAAGGELRALVAGLPAGQAGGGGLLLVGAANAGKSSLCNALCGEVRVLAAAAPGTTRDLVAVAVAPGVTLLDAPGDLGGAGDQDAAALALRDRLAARCAARILVFDGVAAGSPDRAVAGHSGAAIDSLPVAARVLTKIDLGRLEPRFARLLADPGVPTFAVSNATGEGLAEFRAFLVAHGRRGPVRDGTRRRRVADLLARAAVAIDAALATAAAGAGEELVVVELADALGMLDEVHGRSTPEDVLDRIFAGFCLGK